MENNQQSFYQFSDQLRLQASNLANLSLNDSIWSSSYGSKRPDERRNFDIRVGGDFNSPVNSVVTNNNNNSNIAVKPKGSDFNSFNDDWKMGSSGSGSINVLPPSVNLNGFNNDGWKMGLGSKSYGLGPIGSQKNVESYGLGPIGSQKNVGINGGFNKGVYPSKNYSLNNTVNVNLKGVNKNKVEDDHIMGGVVKTGNKKNSNNKKNFDNISNDGKEGKTGSDKRFKTLPPSESLPRNETVGGYIFVCNNDTMQENLKRQLFGLPPRYRDSVRAITPGLPLFLYNYSTHQLHGVFEAASFGGTNIDPSAWEDKKCPGESRFPAQVRVVTRKICEPLEEDSFRPILHHYDGPKFRLELNIPEALSLLDIFEDLQKP